MVICIVGKSSTGKDTLYREILKETGMPKPVVPYTTRPIRAGETDGVEYHFVSEEEMKAYDLQNRIIEKRVYHTVQGDWYYFTPDFEPADGDDYILITTPKVIEYFVKRFGEKALVVIELRLDDQERLLRSIKREAQQAGPNYSEVCRRYLADEEDFSGMDFSCLRHHIINTNQPIQKSVEQITAVIKSYRRDFG